MAKLIELSEEEKDSGPPEPKKQRRMESDEETQEDEEEPDPVDEEEEDEEETFDEFEDDEQELDDGDGDAKEVVEDEKSTDTLKIDEEGEEESKELENKRRFYLTDLDLFDCTVCLRRLNVPIVYLCENEHIVCSCCFSSSSMCTVCVPTTRYKRCRILEKILKSIGESCENLKYGCKRPVHYTMKLDHEKYCKFGPCACPLQPCNFLAPSMELSLHLSIGHPDSITRFPFDRLYSVGFGYDERFCVLQESNSGDVFLVRNMKHDIGNLIVVNQIGPLSFRSRFSLDLQARDGKRHSLRFKCEIESIRGLFDGPPTGDFLVVPSRYFEGDEGFELQLRISCAISDS